MSNPAYTRADRLLTKDSEQPSTVTRERAQVEATLAVAFEQNTANLIEWWKILDGRGSCEDECDELAAEIQKRLQNNA